MMKMYPYTRLKYKRRDNGNDRVTGNYDVTKGYIVTSCALFWLTPSNQNGGNVSCNCDVTMSPSGHGSAEINNEFSLINLVCVHINMSGNVLSCSEE